MQTLYLALEKRYNFSVEDLDIVAYGYRHFRSFFHVNDSGINSFWLHILPYYKYCGLRVHLVMVKLIEDRGWTSTRWVLLNADLLKLLDIVMNTTPNSPTSVGHSSSYDEKYYFDVRWHNHFMWSVSRKSPGRLRGVIWGLGPACLTGQ